MSDGVPNSGLTLRVSGLGYSITFEQLPPDSTTVNDLKQKIFQQTNLPVEYQRLLARGHKLDDVDGNMSLGQAGIKDRTKIMLMHNELYAKEKDIYDQLSKVEKEIDDLEAANQKDDGLAHPVVSEMVTRICCKLDAIQTDGSTNLRSRRKMLLRRAEALDHNSTVPSSMDNQL